MEIIFAASMRYRKECFRRGSLFRRVGIRYLKRRACLESLDTTKTRKCQSRTTVSSVYRDVLRPFMCRPVVYAYRHGTRLMPRESIALIVSKTEIGNWESDGSRSLSARPMPLPNPDNQGERASGTEMKARRSAPLRRNMVNPERF